ncbi:DUF3108 domain-containing protein [Beijerinckia mobilis]|uniref:DUF3108 domain-containing protein n=1 Tax=Beijerinckia mobilis TaxID=231434 RepID=UPI000B0D6B2B|nr:DUF3108 domain-containing protein [Beijerinckia mobilis]
MGRRQDEVRPSFLLIATALGIPAGLVAGLATPAAADMIRAQYRLSLVGLEIGNAIATGNVEPSHYKIDLNARLTGVAAMVSNMRLAFASTGALHSGSVLPASYATTSGTEQETHTVRMRLKSGTVKALDISPPFEDWEGRVPVTEALKRNILDPTSALIMAVPENQPLVGPAACNRTLRIYDGYIRYDVALSYAGTRDVQVTGYSGPVSVCAARYRPIAGHKLDSQSTRFMAENREIEAWLAPVEKAHVVVPVHVSLMTLAGLAVVEATEFSVEPSSTMTARSR